MIQATDNMKASDWDFLKEIEVNLPLNSEQLKRYLPHRYPFVMLDRVVSICPGKSIVGYKNVSSNEQFFNGHFPDQPLMPGVLMVEALAQLAGVLGFISDKKDLADGGIYLFGGVDKVRFKRQVIPGDRLLLEAEAAMVKRNVYKYKCKASVDGELAASAEVMLIKQTRDALK
ncbi:3-hydroxyacyl-ACP dehydratase FabZ [Psychrobacter sp. HD31]|uniref:3-hydroxyacyl-ACP dehydratase FabZ n=1 Tax=Psychrobacter sp. HD31 TaxID=3112003 RepID=UPI003DA3B776